MPSRHTNRIVHLLAFLLLTSTAAAGDSPRVRNKADAPETLQNVFRLQDDTTSRRGFAGLHLQRRSIAPSRGIEPGLVQRTVSAERPALVVVRLDRFPSADGWRARSSEGITAVAYLGNRHWLVRTTRPIDDTFAALRAASIHAYQADDKIAPALDRPVAGTGFYDVDQDLVIVEVTLAEADDEVASSLRDSFHRDSIAFLDHSGGRIVSLVVDPSRVAELAALDTVIAIEPGAWRLEALMDGVRATVDAENVLGSNGQVLTGDGIRMANNERLGLGGGHEDYYEHDLAGNPTVPRFTDAIETSCLATGGNGAHGQMTAGIMLGNGWRSENNGGAPFAFRGIAPEATYDCYDEPGGRPHLSSHSYVSFPESTNNTVWDAAVVGDLGDQRQHAHVAAGGNDGISRGYFSMRNNSKNAIIVANAQVHGHIHPSNSSGPTHDGRIKPDIAAPTRNYRPDLEPGFSIEIEKIELVRGPAKIYRWEFDTDAVNWHQGWGDTDNVPAFGQNQLTAVQSPAGNLLLTMDSKPWGSQWSLSPVVGTQVVPYSHPMGGGQPLNYLGHQDDVLEIRYRAVLPNPGAGIGYFDMKPTWIRVFPPGSTSDWHSQGNHGAVGIGDGQWRTLRVPVGQATDIFAFGNPYWPDERTWDGFHIQYLALRFNATDHQPTTAHPQYYQRSGGTSGASPVVGGAYALAMEHLTTLYRKIDLEDKARKSVYVPSALPPFGMPHNSTWKAVFVHTAKDMTDSQIGIYTPLPPNPDTGVPTSYHAGPDFTTGYGMLNVESGVDLMTRVSEGAELYDIIEASLASGQFHTYELDVPDSFVAGTHGLKVTLAWDDEPAYGSTSQIEPKIVNNLGLVLQDPDGNKYYPWTIDLPYEYDETNGPHVVEPEPITDADIVPARRDLPNDRDNLEQVQIDDLTNDQSGTWLVHVVDNGMGAPSLSLQSYSLVISPWRVAGQCHECPSWTD